MQRKEKSKKSPPSGFIELEYPIHDKLENHIVFTTRSRKRSQTNRGQNLLKNDKQLEIYLHVPDDLNSSAMVSYETG